MIPWGPHEVRAVTHFGIERGHIERVIDVVARVQRTAVPVAIGS